PLTEVRDAQILVESLDKLTECFASEVSGAQFSEVRATLVEHQQMVSARVLDQEHAPAHIIDVLKAARRRVKDWKIRTNGWKALADGLKSSLGRGRKAFAAASVEPTVENLHEWRKRVKDLWHQLQIVQAMEPILEREANQAHQLADILGDEHDLAVLSQFLNEAPAKFGEPSAVATLLSLVVRGPAELQQAANVLGRKVHAEKPRDFVVRLYSYWQTWRARTQAREAG